MSENEPRPAEHPYGSEPPTNPYGQPVPPSMNPSANPFSDTGSQQPSQPSQQHPAPSFGQSSGEQHGGSSAAPWDSQHGSYPSPSAPGGYAGGSYGSDPYAVGPYGMQQPRGDQRPGTVTAAGWTTIVLSALSALLFIFLSFVFLVAQGPMVDEMRSNPGFDDIDVDPGSVVGILVAVMIGFALWSVIGVVLGVAVLRRSNVGRILLVISSAVVALISLIGIGSGVSVLTLAAAVAVIILLFVGGANDWFARRTGPSPYSGVGGYGSSSYGGYGSTPYGGTGSTYGGGDQPYGGDQSPGGDQPYGGDQSPGGDQPYGGTHKPL